MEKNGFIKNKTNIKAIQKAILAGIGAATSQELIKKAAVGLYDDAQKIVHGLFEKLEEKGELTTKSTKHLVKQLQKKSQVEKQKIYKQLQKDCKGLLNKATNIILTPLIVAKEISSKINKTKTRTWTSVKSKTKRAKRKKRA